MHENHLKSNPTHHFLRYRGFGPQVALRCLLLVGAVLLPATSPHMGLQRLVECEAPIDEAGSSEEAVTRPQGTTNHRGPRPHSSILVVVPCDTTFGNVVKAESAVPTGHRLSNHLMAPLRL